MLLFCNCNTLRLTATSVLCTLLLVSNPNAVPARGDEATVAQAPETSPQDKDPQPQQAEDAALSRPIAPEADAPQPSTTANLAAELEAKPVTADGDIPDTDKQASAPPVSGQATSPTEPTTAADKLISSRDVPPSPKQFIGATAYITEKQSRITYHARVDTGAKSCSIHTEKVVIKDPAESMEENIGKSVRIKLKNKKDDTEWVEAKINRLVKVKTSERAEKRYGVSMVLAYKDVEKEVSVTLNDRSHMVYPLLLGRNYLEGDFVVDVGLPHPQ